MVHFPIKGALTANLVPRDILVSELVVDPLYLTRLESTLKWIEARRDPTDEWYWGNLPNGAIGPHGTNKGD